MNYQCVPSSTIPANFSPFAQRISTSWALVSLLCHSNHITSYPTGILQNLLSIVAARHIVNPAWYITYDKLVQNLTPGHDSCCALSWIAFHDNLPLLGEVVWEAFATLTFFYQPNRTNGLRPYKRPQSQMWGRLTVHAQRRFQLFVQDLVSVLTVNFRNVGIGKEPVKSDSKHGQTSLCTVIRQ